MDLWMIGFTDSWIGRCLDW